MKQTIFQMVKKSILRAVVLSLLLGGIGFSVASVSEGISPQGQTDGGAIYKNWFQKIFIDVPEDLKTEITDPIAVQAASLAGENGTEAMWAKQWSTKLQNKQEIKKSSVSLGENLFDDPEKMLRIIGDAPVAKIEAISGNPELKIGTVNAHGALYFDASHNSLNVWNGETGLTLGNESADFPVNLTVNNTNLIASDRWCEEGLVRGFDDNGDPLCTPFCTDDIYTDCIVVDNWCRTDTEGRTYGSCRIYDPNSGN